ncbi:hypothetical protein EIP91_006933 [Steccherinum ochraceum]|uniref:Hemimethylated DNA-binding domain-containing protein n=1 Tax=Steccherinum ochraceum TaxID=92696 RepID=A0A4R0RAQ0_9APHY|nr:hypothetical protein EIP91_006933 [Steccherinum ochraceum]
MSSSSSSLLAPDVYLEILKHLPASRNDDSAVKTLVSCLQANSRVRSAALYGPLWKPHYLARYTHRIEENEKSRLERTRGNWRLMFFERRALDRKALLLADEIRLLAGNSELRRDKAKEFTTSLSFDVWDALRLEACLPHGWDWLEVETEDELLTGSNPPTATRGHLDSSEVLPRKFWAEAILGIIVRFNCIDIWSRLFSRSQPDMSSTLFVRGLTSLSSGYNVSEQEVQLQSRDIYHYFVPQLESYRPPGSPGFNVLRNCLTFMDSFPHIFLQPNSSSRLAPTSLIFVFIIIARFMGIEATPVIVASRYHVILWSSDTSKPSYLVDVLSPDEDPVPIAIAQEQLPRGPIVDAPAALLITTVFGNFATDERVRIENIPQHEARDAALYVMSMCSTMTVVDAQGAIDIFAAAPEFCPLDLDAVQLDGVPPVLDSPQREITGQEVAHFVGMFFRDEVASAEGCVLGWVFAGDANRELNGQGVDLLPFKPDKIVFRVLVRDNPQLRYVGEHIVPICPTPQLIRALYKEYASFGRFFTGVDLNSERKKGRLLLSKELQVHYPDDDDFGAKWVSSEE